MSRDRNGNFLRGLVVGLVAGAGLIHYLNNTPEGKKAKKKLLKDGRKALEGAREIIGEIEEKSAQVREKTKQIEAEVRARVDELSETGKQIKEEIDQVASPTKKSSLGRKFFHKNGKKMV